MNLYKSARVTEFFQHGYSHHIYSSGMFFVLCCKSSWYLLIYSYRYGTLDSSFHWEGPVLIRNSTCTQFTVPEKVTCIHAASSAHIQLQCFRSPGRHSYFWGSLTQTTSTWRQYPKDNTGLCIALQSQTRGSEWSLCLALSFVRASFAAFGEDNKHWVGCRFGGKWNLRTVYRHRIVRTQTWRRERETSRETVKPLPIKILLSPKKKKGWFWRLRLSNMCDLA